MATYREFVDRYGDDYDTEIDRRAAYQRHEQNRVELSEIFFGDTTTTPRERPVEYPRYTGYIQALDEARTGSVPGMELTVTTLLCGPDRGDRDVGSGLADSSRDRVRRSGKLGGTPRRRRPWLTSCTTSRALPS